MCGIPKCPIMQYNLYGIKLIWIKSVSDNRSLFQIMQVPLYHSVKSLKLSLRHQVFLIVFVNDSCRSSYVGTDMYCNPIRDRKSLMVANLLDFRPLFSLLLLHYRILGLYIENSTSQDRIVRYITDLTI